jgi:hypothetical protein
MGDYIFLLVFKIRAVLGKKGSGVEGIVVVNAVTARSETH